MTEIRRSYCGLCHLRCGLLLEVEKGRIIRAKGDREHPITRGGICSRGSLMPDHVHHPDRINYPIKRQGERGSGKWQRLGWDQALDEVAEKLEALREKDLAAGTGETAGRDRLQNIARLHTQQETESPEFRERNERVPFDLPHFGSRDGLAQTGCYTAHRPDATDSTVDTPA